MKIAPISIAIILSACAQLQTPQGQALVTTAEQIANVAISAAASSYAGPEAGQLAAAGLDALAQVLNGYIGRTAPPQIVIASPGIKGVGPAVSNLITETKPISAADVLKISKAAKIARSSASP